MRDNSHHNIPFGEYNTVPSRDYLENRISDFRNSNKKKKWGLPNNNYFVKTRNDENDQLAGEMNALLGQNLDWSFEFCHSGEPTILHTDCATVPWDDTTEIQVVVGCIIPLDWNCHRHPYTVMYNRRSDVQRKMMFHDGDMIYEDNGEKYQYRQDPPVWDEKVIKHIPRDTEYFKMFSDVEIDSEYKWNKSTMLVFDTRRWHSSNWFTESTTIRGIEDEFKEWIVGFGSINVPIKWNTLPTIFDVDTLDEGDDIDLSHLRFIEIVGTEPFHSKNFEWFLDKLEKEVLDPNNCQLMIKTNGSVFPDKAILSKLEYFSKLVIQFSIDREEKLAECIQQGVDWETIDANMRQFKKHRDAMNNRKDIFRNAFGMHLTVDPSHVCYNLCKDLFDA